MGSAIFKKPPLKKMSKDGYFGVDMHFHTRYSLDGISRIRSCVKKAERKNIGFAITDHNAVKGVIASYRKRKHAVIIPGIEVTCKNGNHVLGYFYSHRELEEFFNKEIKPNMRNPFFSSLSLYEVVRRMEKYNCVKGAPHPFAPGAVSMMNTGVCKTVEKNLNFIEVINGYNFRNLNMKALMWASKLNKGMTGGSDGHSTIELGRSMTFTQHNDIDGILDDIKKNRSLVMGKEDNLFQRAAYTITKGTTYVGKCKKKHITQELIKSQMGVEYTYFRKRFKQSKAIKFLQEHHHELDE